MPILLHRVLSDADVEKAIVRREWVDAQRLISTDQRLFGMTREIEYPGLGAEIVIVVGVERDRPVGFLLRKLIFVAIMRRICQCSMGNAIGFVERDCLLRQRMCMFVIAT